MEWTNNGKLATAAEIREFEKVHGVHLLDEHKGFLMHVVNGGTPAQEKCIHAENCPGGAGTLHGVLGVNQSKPYYDLGEEIEHYRYLLPWLMPFGYDQGNGPLFVDMKGRPGRIVYTPWDETEDEPMPTYHVADSINAFLEASPLPL